MYRGGNSSVEDIKEVSQKLEDSGYYSMLMVYHSKISDYFIKAARAIDPRHRLKYMQAIRTYAISPEYCAMMCEAFNEISNNRLMLNIVSGDLHKDETSIDDVVFINEMIKTPDQRLKYTEEWISKFNSLDIMSNKPEIVMAGHSEKTKRMAKDLGYTHVSQLNMYLESYNLDTNIINEKQMVALGISIKENTDEAENFFSKLTEAEKGWTICGTVDFITEKISWLQKMGVTDIMVVPLSGDNPDDIHSLIKSILEKQNGIN
jgi:alkanesulfonate monooxygenase SsuD/methylene tetrahydromethanopterin reductase-like flavin-dependent oxidoreductase (luciferase family)